MFLQLLLEDYMPELERVKLAVKLKEEEGMPQQSGHRSQDTVRLVTSNLPELHNWGAPLPLHES
jgi:hypothetical protein